MGEGREMAIKTSGREKKKGKRAIRIRGKYWQD